MRRRSLSTRLIVAMMSVALIVLALSYLATFALVRRSLRDNALSNLRDRATELQSLVTDDPNVIARPQLRQAALKLTDLRLIAVAPDGTIVNAVGSTGLQSSLRAADLLPSELLANNEVSGRRGNTVFLAIPTERKTLTGARYVVVATDDVDTSVLRKVFPLLLVVGVLVLAATAAVAAWLARRMTRPLRELEQTASRIATGDLSARASVPDSTEDELATLAATLNNMAAQLEQARGSEHAFFLSISHDLRTPLTSIRGYAEALADGTIDGNDTEARKRAAVVIGAEARRLERLVRDLLDLARLDARGTGDTQFSLHPQQCNATEVVRSAAEAFAPKAHEIGVRLDVRDGPALRADLDPERLAQIVANLVENALKYATTRVEVYTATYDDGQVAVVVTDDGPGISADDAVRVFDRLYTVRDTPGRSVGTGLGLAIVRELAAVMGGRAWVDTTVSAGTRFVVALPRTIDEAAEESAS